MPGMTVPACPVCATPHAPDADACAFCGVSLRETEPIAETRGDAPSQARIASAAPAPAEETEAPGAPREAIANEAEQHAAFAPPGDDAGDDAGEARPTSGAASPAPDEETTEAGDSADAPESSPDTAAETAEIPANPAPSASTRPRAPSFARAPTTASLAQRRWHRIEWGIVAALAAMLLVQVVVSDFDQLAAGRATRPWLQRMCNALRCTLPPWRETRALRLLQRDVRANPGRPGTLRVSASFRNDARWAQPWPRLRVVLSDADGRAIAARDFRANEYLAAPPTASGIASGQVAGAAFDVVDPSPRVTAFTFEFRQDGMASATGPR